MARNGPYVSSTQVASSTPFDNASQSYNSTDVQAALVELRQHPVWDETNYTTSLNGTTTLTSSDTGFIAVSGSATGHSIKMPDATTLFKGQQYEIANQSSQPITIKDSTGTTLFTLSQTSIGYLTLQANGTAAGTWVFWQVYLNTASGIVSYNIVSSTNFSSSANVDTLITGMTVIPAAGTYAVWYNAENTGTGSGQQLDCTIYNNGSAVTDSKRLNLSTSGSHIFQNSTMTISQFNGTGACEIRVNPNGNSFTVGVRSMLLIRLGP